MMIVAYTLTGFYTSTWIRNLISGAANGFLYSNISKKISYSFLICYQCKWIKRINDLDIELVA